MKKKEYLPNGRKDQILTIYENWRDCKYPYWKTHVFIPWKKKMMKRFKRGWRKFSITIKYQVKFLIRKYKYWRSNADRRGQYNIHIQNIENIQIGEKRINYKNILNLPSTPKEKTQMNLRKSYQLGYLEDQNLGDGRDHFIRSNKLNNSYQDQKMYLKYCPNKINLNFFIKNFEHVQNLYRKHVFQEVISESQKLIEILLEKISLDIGFRYEDVNHFISVLIRKNLKIKFLLYNEIMEYAEFLDISKYQNLGINETADMIFSIYKNIINKIKNVGLNIDRNYSNHLLLKY